MALRRKVRPEEVAWVQAETMNRNRITIEWLMRETATVEGDFVALADGLKVQWHVEKWPQSFEVLHEGEQYFYRTLDDLRMGIRDIRRNSKGRYL